MSARVACNMLLPLMMLLMLSHAAWTLPALEKTLPATAVNSIEETDKLPDTNIAPNAEEDAGLANASTPATEVQEQTMPVDNVASASSNEPVSIYAGGLITPEIFQQYLNQYGGATPGIYPYPGPIMVQTGYEGFLVPANAAAVESPTSDIGGVVAAPGSPDINPLLAFASRLLPTVLLSTLFRIVAVVISAVGVILFGGAITNALCRITPICEIPSKAVSYLRTGGAQDVGRMLAENITPERVRRTTEFVRNAIHKYQLLQQFVEAEPQVGMKME